MHYMRLLLVSAALLLPPLPAAAQQTDVTELYKASIVHLKISNSGYEQAQPWRQTSISQEEGFGCAVAPNRVLTTAENVTNATLVQAMTYEQAEWIPAKVVVVDYEYNLCLLELETGALRKPLKPVTFSELFPKNEQISACWLSSSGLPTSARSILDRAEVQPSPVSFTKNLSFVVSNTSRPFGDGEICAYGDQLVGIAAWGTGSDSGLIPAETINRFLSQASKPTYTGFGAVGFETYNLLDPVMRRYLKLPADIQDGIYVSSVYNLGTGSSQLKRGDVIVSIDGQRLNAFGRYKHPKYDLISFDHLILQKSEGQMISFEIIRDAKPLHLDIEARSVKSSQMLVPYYQYGKQPVYLVTGGYVFQQLTRDYLAMWGEGWPGKVPPHLFNYYFSESFKPTAERKEIVILSYVLPAEVNLGYQQLSQLVVSTVDGKTIASVKDLVETMNAASESPFHTITFEMQAPVLVIPKENLALIDQQIAAIYAVSKPVNLN
ncbi:MAG: hypothetical protein LLF76_12380 [Planctomycetaceae bacterium]|nr:hypothetical protein [Planctomycetaceae bacterium]